MWSADAGIISLAILVVSVVAITLAISACVRNRRQMPLHAQGASTTVGVNMTQMSPPMVQGKPGQPMAPVPGMPMSSAQPMSCYPQSCYPQAHPYPHGGYPCQSGYSSGSVAMGAGMGFLGGMMVGEMMSSHDGGHYDGVRSCDSNRFSEAGRACCAPSGRLTNADPHAQGYGGGGDYGGGDFGGDFAADM